MTKNIRRALRAAALMMALLTALLLAGCGSSSADAAKASEPAIVLSSPLRPKATAPSSTTIKISWQAVEGASHYYVVFQNAEMTTEQVMAAVADPDNAAEVNVLYVAAQEGQKPGANFEGMDKATTYHFCVVAACEQGISEPSIFIASTTPEN